MPPEQERGPALHVVFFVNGWLQREIEHEDDEEEQDEQEGDEEEDVAEAKMTEQEQQQSQSTENTSSATFSISSWKSGFNLAERALKATGEVCLFVFVRLVVFVCPSP